MKFKVGDRIRYIYYEGARKGDLWPHSDIGKTGTIVDISGSIATVKLINSDYKVTSDFTTNFCALEPIVIVGEQLLFDFMKKA